MRSVNRVTLVGHLAADPDMRQTQTGHTLSQFPLVTNRQWKGEDGEVKEEASFHRVIAWRQLAENCAKFLQKGAGVYVEGRLSHRKYEDETGTMRYFTEVIADTVNFLSRSQKVAEAV